MSDISILGIIFNSYILLLKEGKMKNYIKLRKASLFYYHYIFADTEDYLADQSLFRMKLEYILVRNTRIQIASISLSAVR